MRKFMVLAGLALAFAGAAAADTLAVIKENTLIMKDGSGAETSFLLGEEGALELTTKAGAKTGKWFMKDTGQFCWRVDGASYDQCLMQPLPADKAVGDEWEIPVPGGRPSTFVRIVEGKVRLDRHE